jgi:predicted transcriptional regulator
MASRPPARMIGTVAHTDRPGGVTMTTTATSTRSRRRPATTTAAVNTTVDQYDHVAAATYLMKHSGTSALAVLDGQRSNQPIGCITETDIAAAMAQGHDLNETRIRDLIAHGHAAFARLSASQPPTR